MHETYNPIIDMVINARKCNIDLKALLQIDAEQKRFYWDSVALHFWAYAWCIENGVFLRIETRPMPTEDLGSIPYSDYEGGLAMIRMASVLAEVWLDDKKYAATACGTYIVNDKVSRDSIFRNLRKNAIGYALSQAGFGIINGFDMTKEDIEHLQASGILLAEGQSTPLPTDGQNANLPFTMPDTITKAQETQPITQKTNNTKADPFGFGCDDNSDHNSFLSAPAAAKPSALKRPPMPPAQTASTPISAPVSAPSNESANEAIPDEMICWPVQGWGVTGKTLGEILSGPSGIKRLTTLLNIDAKGDAEIIAAQAAIKRILENRQM